MQYEPWTWLIFEDYRGRLLGLDDPIIEAVGHLLYEKQKESLSLLAANGITSQEDLALIEEAWARSVWTYEQMARYVITKLYNRELGMRTILKEWLGV